MPDRIQKKDFIHRRALCMDVDGRTAELWFGGFIETLYETFREGRSVTLPGLGGFYVKPKGKTWAFTFHPGQKLRALFGWSSTYKGEL